MILTMLLPTISELRPQTMFISQAVIMQVAIWILKAGNSLMPGRP